MGFLDYDPMSVDYSDPMSYASDIPRAADDQYKNNLLSLLRLHHIFSPNPSPDMSGGDTNGDMTPNVDAPNIDAPQPAPTNEHVDPLASYQPEHRMTDQMFNMIDHMPQRQEATRGRKIVATLMGIAGGPRAANDVMDDPYNEQMGDWKTKFDAVAKGANDERYSNTNLRQFANEMAMEKYRDENLTRMWNQGDRRGDQTDRKIGDSEHNAAVRQRQNEEKIIIAREAAKGGQFKVDDNGDGYMIYRDGSVKRIDDPSFRSIEEKNTLATNKAVAVTKAREQNLRPRVAKTTIQDPDDPTKTIEGTTDMDSHIFTPSTVAGDTTKAPVHAPVKSTTAGHDNAAMITKREADRAQLYMADHPEVRSYIHIDKNGVRIDKPGWITGPKEEQYNEMQKAIFGGSSMTLPTADKPNPANAPNANNAPPAPKGWKYVAKPGGGWTAVKDQ